MTVPLSGHSMNAVQGTTQILVAGGESSSAQSSPIFIFQTTGSGSWSAPTLSKNDTASFHRLYHASLSTGKDGALLQGGYQTSVANSTVVSTLVSLKASNNFLPLSTSAVALAPSAPALARHTMTLTTDGQAIILGGVDSQGVVANLSIAYILDTQANNGEWRPTPLSGTPPDPRMSFSTVLVNATTMLVFGGTADFKSAFSTPFYLDLPSLTWSSPDMHGDAPERWGHTSTMAGTQMVVAFGTSDQAPTSETNFAVLDTTTNTWIDQYRPVGMLNPDVPGSSQGRTLSVGAILGIAFVVTAFVVGGAFYLLVRRRKRRTRNTLARENMGDQAARTAIKKQTANQGFFARIFRSGSSTTSGAAGSKRYSEMPTYSNPAAICSRMTQMGYSPVSLGYPETVVQHGCGQVSVSSYIYPKQACVETERELEDGQETAVVYHMLTQAQQEAIKLSKQPAVTTTNKNKTKSKLYQLDS
ncbi:hypothetical protein BGZ99_003130 [Dissophora globulifera]|uniref:Galactose oxidase n=1 Tax=Dissophora globulifera TaxID=979702 RepID=A0A9P6RM52_9FUNG|nr:hypothetical protein BGZ99_003130 [Dissophora globulifera]